jgi:hypothetical protein
MGFTGEEGHSISLEKAAEFTANYREEYGTDFLGGYFSKNSISKIFEDENCVGIRIYNAVDDNGKLNYVVVGVDSEGKDLTGGVINEHAIGCPPNCDQSSALM